MTRIVYFPLLALALALPLNLTAAEDSKELRKQRQAAQEENFDQQEFMVKMAGVNEKKKLINIEYRKIRDRNRIKDREKKKDILAN
jgi:hypothetical protein